MLQQLREEQKSEDKQQVLHKITQKKQEAEEDASRYIDNENELETDELKIIIDGNSILQRKSYVISRQRCFYSKELGEITDEKCEAHQEKEEKPFSSYGYFNSNSENDCKFYDWQYSTKEQYDGLSKIFQQERVLVKQDEKERSVKTFLESVNGCEMKKLAYEDNSLASSKLVEKPQQNEKHNKFKWNNYSLNDEELKLGEQKEMKNEGKQKTGLEDEFENRLNNINLNIENNKASETELSKLFCESKVINYNNQEAKYSELNNNLNLNLHELQNEEEKKFSLLQAGNKSKNKCALKVDKAEEYEQKNSYCGMYTNYIDTYDKAFLIYKVKNGDYVSAIFVNETKCVIGTFLGKLSLYIFGKSEMRKNDNNSGFSTDVVQGKNESAKEEIGKDKNKKPENKQRIFFLNKLLQNINKKKKKMRLDKLDEKVNEKKRLKVKVKIIELSAYADDAIRALYVSKNKLYILVGMARKYCICLDTFTYINIGEYYKIDRSLTNGNMKFICIRNNKIFISTTAICCVLDICTDAIHTFTVQLNDMNVSVLDFNGVYAIFYIYNNCEKHLIKVIDIYKTSDESNRGRPFSLSCICEIPLSQSTKFISHAKFWEPNRFVIVKNSRKICFYDYSKNICLYDIKNKDSDIVAINFNKQNLFFLLTKSCELKVFNFEEQKFLYKLSCYPATFYFAWNYILELHENKIFFSADQGVFRIDLFLP